MLLMILFLIFILVPSAISIGLYLAVSGCTGWCCCGGRDERIWFYFLVQFFVFLFLCPAYLGSIPEFEMNCCDWLPLHNRLLVGLASVSSLISRRCSSFGYISDYRFLSHL